MWWYGSSITPLDIRRINLSSRYTENQSLLLIYEESISPLDIRRINLSSRYTENQSLLSLYGESISPLDIRGISLSSRYTENQSLLTIYGESISPRDIRRINSSSRYTENQSLLAIYGESISPLDITSHFHQCPTNSTVRIAPEWEKVSTLVPSCKPDQTHAVRTSKPAQTGDPAIGSNWVSDEPARTGTAYLSAPCGPKLALHSGLPTYRHRAALSSPRTQNYTSHAHSLGPG